MNQSASLASSRTYEKARLKNEGLYEFLATGLVPDLFVRLGIRKMLGQTLLSRSPKSVEAEIQERLAFVSDLKQRGIAIKTSEANEQHYELPFDFFRQVLGPHMKYSCCLWQDDWPVDEVHLQLAEKSMLDLTIQRAGIENGHRVLDLGCGWGALSLYLAEKFPASSVTAVSNSHNQRRYIEAEAAERGICNLRVITQNVENLEFAESFDRVVSVEMFEHMKNYDLLLERISQWLVPDAKLFVHIFTHKTLQYHYEDTDGSDWLTRHFFEGGMMPSDSLLLYFQRNLQVEEHWRVNGVHYGKTAEQWLKNMDSKRKEILPVLASVYGDSQARRWFYYWRLFFIACAELWAYKVGEEWLVSHYLFVKRR